MTKIITKFISTLSLFIVLKWVHLFVKIKSYETLNMDLQPQISLCESLYIIRSKFLTLFLLDKTVTFGLMILIFVTIPTTFQYNYTNTSDVYSVISSTSALVLVFFWSVQKICNHKLNQLDQDFVT